MPSPLSPSRLHHHACWLVLIGFLLDLADGAVARQLDACSALGESAPPGLEEPVTHFPLPANKGGGKRFRSQRGVQRPSWQGVGAFWLLWTADLAATRRSPTATADLQPTEASGLIHC